MCTFTHYSFIDIWPAFVAGNGTALLYEGGTAKEWPFDVCRRQFYPLPGNATSHRTLVLHGDSGYLGETGVPIGT
jgi:hypothetical protein